MFNAIPMFAVVLAASVTPVGQAHGAQPTFRIDMGNMMNVDAPTVKKAFDDRMDVAKQCYADAAVVKRQHHVIRGWFLMTVVVRADGTVNYGRIDDQAIGTSVHSESASDFLDCIQNKMLPKMAFPAIAPGHGREASVTFRVNP